MALFLSGACAEAAGGNELGNGLVGEGLENLDEFGPGWGVV